MSYILETPEQIEAFGHIQIKQRLKLESLGMKGHGASARSQAIGILNRNGYLLLPNANIKLVVAKYQEFLEAKYLSQK